MGKIRDVQSDLSRAVAPTILEATTATISVTDTAQALSATSLCCSYMWVGPCVTAAGVASNTRPIFIGDAGEQVMTVDHDNVAGIFFAVNDLSTVYIKGLQNEVLHYVVFG